MKDQERKQHMQPFHVNRTGTIMVNVDGEEEYQCFIISCYIRVDLGSRSVLSKVKRLCSSMK